MRVVGEVVTLVTRTGGGYDDDGHTLPEVIVNEDIPGAVFIPESAGVINRDDGTTEYREASILLPTFEEITVGATIMVRGEQFTVERPPVDHRSAFGTGRGGTEIFVRRVGR